MATNINSRIIAITGPTASGKTTLANNLAKKIGCSRCVILSQDNYYKDWSYMPKNERKKINFDDIKSFDYKLLIKHLQDLKSGKAVEMPRYSFIKNSRLITRKKVYPKPIIIIEGLILFLNKKLRNLCDLKIYIDTDNYICFARRLRRDVKKRAETIETVCERYFHHVLPMQNKFVEPQKKFSDIIHETIDLKQLAQLIL